jgi:hypothetical protein
MPTTSNTVDATPQQSLAPGADAVAGRSCDKAVSARFANLLGDKPFGSNTLLSTLADSANVDDDEAVSEAAPGIQDGAAASSSLVAGQSSDDGSQVTALKIGDVGHGISRAYADQKAELNWASLAFQIPSSVPMTMTSAMVNSAPSQSAALSTLADNHLQTLLQQLCSGMYLTSQVSASGSRMLLALDATLPAAAVEFVRDSDYLRVRLHARDDASLRSMSAQREVLQTSLGDATDLRVAVEIIRQDEA